MNQYCFIETRSPFDNPEAQTDYRMATELAKAGNKVTLFFAENGVLGCREGAENPALGDLTNVTLYADEFSIRERGITTQELGYGVKPKDINEILMALEDGHKTIWL